MEPREYGFDERLVMSGGHSASSDVRDVLMQCIPGSLNAYKAAPSNDRLGVDWWVEMPNARHLAVDAKVREEDWATKNPPHDDLAIETLSVVESGKIGWTRDDTKRCDYVLWLWKDTGRYCLLPFPMLCKVTQENWESWRETYKVSRQRTPWGEGFYHSECVFVPRRVVWRLVYELFGGSPCLQKAGA